MIVGAPYGLLRILIVGPLAYLALIAILRISGKRTLSKMSAFDFVVTVALGSTLATVLLTKDIPLAEGVIGFAVLAALQFVITWTAKRSNAVESTIKAEPRIILIEGQFDRKAMEKERVTEEEVRSAVRKTGQGDLANIAAVFLETDGSFSVIARDAAGDRSAFPRRTLPGA
ncbi:MAG: YetF domain-containing protein [Sphingomicrobium sp.]